MRTKLRALALALAATALTATAADAAIQLQSYSFTASSGGPIRTHIGSFVLAYDDVAHDYSLLAIDFTIGSYRFDLSNSAAVTLGSTFVVGGKVSGTERVLNYTNDFFINSEVFSYSLENGEFGVGLNPLMRIELSNPTPTPGAVPEPSAWALMILGFGSAGVALRRRRLAAA